MKDLGLVSIITPNYNCERFIAQTIESVLNQTYLNWEMLIQDDCSIDNSISIAFSYAKKDSRIKVQINPKNSGAAVTRNIAIKRSRGKYIAFLDSDDLWMPEKLELQLNFMLVNNYDFTYHDYTEINEDGNDLGIYVSGIEKITPFHMYSCCWPGCLTVIYNQEKVGIIQIKDVKKNNDSALWLKVIRKTNCYILKKNLAYYRKREFSLTPKPIWKRILAHYPLFRIAEEMNPINSIFWTIVNCIVNTIKKLFYVKNLK